MDRRLTWSAKWDLLAKPFGSDAISLSVADTEFASPIAVRDALSKRVENGAFGYTEVFSDFADACASWQSNQHSFNVSSSDVVFTPRIILTLAAILHRFPTVAVISPGYGPINEVIERSDSTCIQVPLNYVNGEFTLNLDALTNAMRKSDLLVWCSPHNPTGRVWSLNELKLIASLAKKYNCVVFSDEVHADIVRAGQVHLPLASVAPELDQEGLIITAVSPAKTFNIAGLECAALISKNYKIRSLLQDAKRRAGIHNPNTFAIPGCIAAWENGADYRDALCVHTDYALVVARDLLLYSFPNLRVSIPEGTYLLWIDASAYVTGAKDLLRWSKKAHVPVTLGEEFGSAYSRWFRINVAMPIPQLLEALNRLISIPLA